MSVSSPQPIKRLIALDAQITACNLRCSYCYVRQQKRDSCCIPDYSGIIPKLSSAFSEEVLGGIAYIYIYADGETLLASSMAEVIEKLLECGHYVSIVTNMTCRGTLDKILPFSSEYRSKITFICSLHYTELARKNKLNDFAENITIMRQAGCSCIVRLCMAPEYLPHLETIRKYCKDYLGGDPILCHYVEDHGVPPEIEAQLLKAAKQFHCYGYDFQKSITRVRMNDYCHAGEWSFAVSLVDGDVRDCLHGKVIHNIYDNPGRKIPSKPVGLHCPLPWCMCGVHFLSWGVRPTVHCLPYASLFEVDGKNYLSLELQRAFMTKLDVSNAAHHEF